MKTNIYRLVDKLGKTKIIICKNNINSIINKIIAKDISFEVINYELLEEIDGDDWIIMQHQYKYMLEDYYSGKLYFKSRVGILTTKTLDRLKEEYDDVYQYLINNDIKCLDIRAYKISVAYNDEVFLVLLVKRNKLSTNDIKERYNIELKNEYYMENGKLYEAYDIEEVREKIYKISINFINKGLHNIQNRAAKEIIEYERNKENEWIKQNNAVVDSLNRIYFINNICEKNQDFFNKVKLNSFLPISNIHPLVQNDKKRVYYLVYIAYEKLYIDCFTGDCTNYSRIRRWMSNTTQELFDNIINNCIIRVISYYCTSEEIKKIWYTDLINCYLNKIQLYNEKIQYMSFYNIDDALKLGKKMTDEIYKYVINFEAHQKQILEIRKEGRLNNKIAFIYEMHNLLDNTYYIGSSENVNPVRRFYEHFNKNDNLYKLLKNVNKNDVTFKLLAICDKKRKLETEFKISCAYYLIGKKLINKKFASFLVDKVVYLLGEKSINETWEYLIGNTRKIKKDNTFRIYVIHNIYHDKYYIGQTKERLKLRLWQHLYKTKSRELLNDINELKEIYGDNFKDYFTIDELCTCKTNEECFIKEKYWTEEYAQKYKLYNILAGAEVTDINYRLATNGCFIIHLKSLTICDSLYHACKLFSINEKDLISQLHGHGKVEFVYSKK